MPSEPTDHRAEPNRTKPLKKADSPIVDTGQLDSETAEIQESRSHFLRRIGVRGLPPALVSLIFHLVVLTLIALIYLPSDEKGQFGFFMQTSDSLDDDFDQEFELSNNEEFTPETSLSELESVSAEDSLDNFEAELAKIESSIPAVTPEGVPGFALSGRGEQNRKGMLARFGGTPETEDAVELGLKWLAKNQQRDGSWSLKGPYRSLVAEENQMAATGLALLAFLGHGETHQSGKYQKRVEKGLQYLIKNQSGSGHFLERRASVSHSLYTHAICSIAVCETLAITKDESFVGPARDAIDFAVKAQGPQGGWKYEVGQVESDLSVTGWFVMLFQSAKYAGIDYDPSVLTRVESFLDSVMSADGSQFRYQTDHASTPAMTAEGLLCRQYLGWKKNDPRLQAGVKRLQQNPIRWSQKNAYYWYYATQVMRHLDDKSWEAWNKELKSVLPERQVKSGADTGSWDPDNDPYGGPGGRLYMTCLSIYCLEVYYRHLPIYQMQ